MCIMHKPLDTLVHHPGHVLKQLQDHKVMHHRPKLMDVYCHSVLIKYHFVGHSWLLQKQWHAAYSTATKHFP